MSGHHHHAPESDRGLKFAVAINLLLTFAQAIELEHHTDSTCDEV